MYSLYVFIIKLQIIVQNITQIFMCKFVFYSIKLIAFVLQKSAKKMSNDVKQIFIFAFLSFKIVILTNGCMEKKIVFESVEN